MRRLIASLTAVATAAFMLAAPAPAAAQTEVTLWTHWAAEKIKRDFVEDAIRRFEEKNPGVKIKASWYEKTALYARSRRRCAPARRRTSSTPSRTRSSTWRTGSCSISPTSTGRTSSPGRRSAWSYKGKPYGFPLEASTVELYYNKKMVDELGVKIPDSLQLSPDAFLDLVKKAQAKGWTPMSLGVGDRPFPGAYLTHEALLKKLGTDDYDKLLKGKLAWSDPRVVDTLEMAAHTDRRRPAADELHEPQARRGAHLFPHQPRRRDVPERQLVHLARLQPAGQGRPAEGLPARRDEVPGRAGRRLQRLPHASVQGSYVANADTKRKKEVLAFFNSMASEEAGNRWLENVLVQTGIKSDVSKITGPERRVFPLLAATNKDAKYYFGAPSQIMQGKAKEVFTQVINNAFPAGTIGVEDAVKQLQASY